MLFIESEMVEVESTSKVLILLDNNEIEVMDPKVD